MATLSQVVVREPITACAHMYLQTDRFKNKLLPHLALCALLVRNARKKWPTEGTMKCFMHALITLLPSGSRRYEGEKHCIRKMIGAKLANLAYKIRFEQLVWLRLQNSKDVQEIYLFVTNRPSGKIFTEWLLYVTDGTLFFCKRCPGRLQRWWY